MMLKKIHFHNAMLTDPKESQLRNHICVHKVGYK